jgi:hypothetical protein
VEGNYQRVLSGNVEPEDSGADIECYSESINFMVMFQNWTVGKRQVQSRKNVI